MYRGLCAPSPSTLRSLFTAVFRLWSNATYVSGQSFSHSAFRFTTCPAFSINISRILKGFSSSWMRMPCLRISRSSNETSKAPKRATEGKIFTLFMGSPGGTPWPRPRSPTVPFRLTSFPKSLFSRNLDADEDLSWLGFIPSSLAEDGSPFGLFRAPLGRCEEMTGNRQPGDNFSPPAVYAFLEM